MTSADYRGWALESGRFEDLGHKVLERMEAAREHATGERAKESFTVGCKRVEAQLLLNRRLWLLMLFWMRAWEGRAE